jgi:hypothetical protein
MPSKQRSKSRKSKSGPGRRKSMPKLSPTVYQRKTRTPSRRPSSSPGRRQTQYYSFPENNPEEQSFFERSRSQLRKHSKDIKDVATIVGAGGALYTAGKYAKDNWAQILPFLTGDAKAAIAAQQKKIEDEKQKLLDLYKKTPNMSKTDFIQYAKNAAEVAPTLWPLIKISIDTYFAVKTSTLTLSALEKFLDNGNTQFNNAMRMGAFASVFGGIGWAFGGPMGGVAGSTLGVAADQMFHT